MSKYNAIMERVLVGAIAGFFILWASILLYHFFTMGS
jgi:hypothetical protein